jgi:hypothetical protein
MPDLAVVIVGTDEDRFRHVEANEARLALAREVAAHTREKVDIVVHVANGSHGASKWRATPRTLRRDRDADWASYETPGWSAGSLWAEVTIWSL